MAMLSMALPMAPVPPVISIVLMRLLAVHCYLAVLRAYAYFGKRLLCVVDYQLCDFILDVAADHAADISAAVLPVFSLHTVYQNTHQKTRCFRKYLPKTGALTRIILLYNQTRSGAFRRKHKSFRSS